FYYRGSSRFDSFHGGIALTTFGTSCAPNQLHTQGGSITEAGLGGERDLGRQTHAPADSSRPAACTASARGRARRGPGCRRDGRVVGSGRRCCAESRASNTPCPTRT